ncbi:hypothetical protein E5343_00620 [Rodentibacter caecimuris]|uniref:Uncharacterized protein n=1 Tax=Rodentibacter caecimuris TaxID=1796644 RepID=A0A9X8W0M2_9PAST|nr:MULTISPECIES: hypothetical protein [Pasteurellaceae]AOF54424.1 hypothetical protein AC062_2338 [Pasteurellaceae bacterium NI1060]MCR1838547.1 hypothetical protein [Pasteurella caecimuris]MCU0107858.1 hypothetical protein [Pasteurella caecimuris]OOF72389.1 hypothetical protein BKG90_04680 [Rodentibacter heylii]TGY50883.1 hypothetical protein E5343_00620 [Pasteurella caecimuris]
MNATNIIAIIIVILAFCSPFALIYWIVRKIKKYIGQKNKPLSNKSEVYIKNKSNINTSVIHNQNFNKKINRKLHIVSDMNLKNYTNEEIIELVFDPFLRIKTFSDELKTNVTYRDYNGNIIFDRTFTALEMRSERIDNYLLIQFARSDGDDAFKLYFIDLLNNKVIFSVYPEFYWDEVNSYDGNILVIKNKYGSFEVNNFGQLVDNVTYLKAVAVSYSIESLDAVSQLFSKLDKNKDNIQFYHSVLDECFVKIQSEFHALGYLANLLKIKGEIFEYQNDFYNAYRVYALGLKLNAKLSVRNAIKRVSKQLRQNTIDSINKSITFLADSLIAKNKELREKSLEKSRLGFEEGVRTGRIVIKESEK